MPAEFSCGRCHPIGELGASERRHRIRAPPRPLEDIAEWVDRTVYIAGLAGDADLVLHLVVIGLKLVQSERPILHCRTFRNSPSAIAASGFAHDIEVPWVKPPALRPVMQRGAADRIHHRMNR